MRDKVPERGSDEHNRRVGDRVNREGWGNCPSSGPSPCRSVRPATPRWTVCAAVVGGAAEVDDALASVTDDGGVVPLQAPRTRTAASAITGSPEGPVPACRGPTGTLIVHDAIVAADARSASQPRSAQSGFAQTWQDPVAPNATRSCSQAGRSPAHLTGQHGIRDRVPPGSSRSPQAPRRVGGWSGPARLRCQDRRKDSKDQEHRQANHRRSPDRGGDDLVHGCMHASETPACRILFRRQG